MSFEEANLLIDNFYDDHKESWEQMRYLGLLIKTQSQELLKDLLKFPWDNKKIENTKPLPSREKLEKLAEERLKLLQNG